MFEIDNSAPEIDRFFLEQETFFKSTNDAIIIMNIDGMGFYHELKKNLLSQIASVQTVRFERVSVKKLSHETLLAVTDYCDKITSSLPDMTDGFYQGGSTQTWNNFTLLLEGLHWMNDALTGLIRIDNGIDVQVCKPFLEDLNMKMKELHEFLIQKDTISIADLLNYDLQKLIVDLKFNTTQLTENGVV